MPDLSKLEKHRSSSLLVLGIGIASFVGLLIAAAWAGFLLFKPFRGFQGQGLQLAIDGPQRVVLGEEVTYFVNWKNGSSDPLASADIRVSFPVDFTMTKAEPASAQDGLTWRLGSIPFGGRGTVMIRGIFTGALGTKTAIQAVGTYRPASFNSDFEALATRQVEYGDTVLTGAVAVPQKVLPGDKIRIGYTVQNFGLVPMKHLEARISLPVGFVRDVTTSTDAIDERTVQLPVGDIAAGASTTLMLTGSFASGHAGEAAVHAEIGRVGVDGSFQAAQKTDASFIVLSGDLSLKLVVNGSDVDRAIGLGEILRIAIGYENTAAEPIQGVTIRLKFQSVVSTATVLLVGPKKPQSPDLVDWVRLEDGASGTISGNTISWSKEQLGVLERLPPQHDGAIEFAVPTIGGASGTTISGVQLIAEATMKSVGDVVVNRTVATAPMTFRFRTDADVTVEARYTSEEGATLGSGPLPPVVGQTTRYRIFWDLSKSIHELKGMRVSATLPKRVAWAGNTMTSAGEVKYDEASRTVSWALNRVPADVNEANMTFDIDLTPSDFDVGRFADLLGETRFEATDVDIGEQLVRNKPLLTTDLQNDEGARSKGVVRKP